MPIFDFLSGQPTMPDSGMSSGLSQYQNLNSGQGMNYQNVLGGGNSSPATQGLDWNKIGQWAINRQLQQAQQAPNYQQALAALNGMAQNPSQVDPSAYMLHGGGGMGMRGAQQGPQQQYAGYVGNGMTPQMMLQGQMNPNNRGY